MVVRERSKVMCHSLGCASIPPFTYSLYGLCVMEKWEHCDLDTSKQVCALGMRVQQLISLLCSCMAVCTFFSDSDRGTSASPGHRRSGSSVSQHSRSARLKPLPLGSLYHSLNVSVRFPLGGVSSYWGFLCLFSSRLC